MTRRTALKLLGAMIICQAGEVISKEWDIDQNVRLVFTDWENTKHDYLFHAKTIGKIIIEKEDGSKINIEFSEIVKALTDN